MQQRDNFCPCTFDANSMRCGPCCCHGIWRNEHGALTSCQFWPGNARQISEALLPVPLPLPLSTSCLTRLYRFGTRHAAASNCHLPLAAGHIMLQHEHLNLQLRPFGLICVRCERHNSFRALPCLPWGHRQAFCSPTICINMQRV